MKNLKRIVVVLGVVAAVGAVQAHEAHKQVKGGATTTAPAKSTPAKSTPAKSTPAKPTLPAASVTKVDLTGELIDTQCWFTHNGEGKDHAACAVKCAKGGQDLAFLDTRTGEVHSLIASGHGNNPNEGLYDRVGVPVRVRGTSYKRGPNRGLLLDNVALAK